MMRSIFCGQWIRQALPYGLALSVAIGASASTFAAHLDQLDVQTTVSNAQLTIRSASPITTSLEHADSHQVVVEVHGLDPEQARQPRSIPINLRYAPDVTAVKVEPIDEDSLRVRIQGQNLAAPKIHNAPLGVMPLQTAAAKPAPTAISPLEDALAATPAQPQTQWPTTPATTAGGAAPLFQFPSDTSVQPAAADNAAESPQPLQLSTAAVPTENTASQGFAFVTDAFAQPASAAQTVLQALPSHVFMSFVLGLAGFAGLLAFLFSRGLNRHATEAQLGTPQAWYPDAVDPMAAAHPNPFSKKALPPERFALAQGVQTAPETPLLMLSRRHPAQQFAEPELGLEAEDSVAMRRNMTVEQLVGLSQLGVVARQQAPMQSPEQASYDAAERLPEAPLRQAPLLQQSVEDSPVNQAPVQASHQWTVSSTSAPQVQSGTGLGGLLSSNRPTATAGSRNAVGPNQRRQSVSQRGTGARAAVAATPNQDEWLSVFQKKYEQLQHQPAVTQNQTRQATPSASQQARDGFSSSVTQRAQQSRVTPPTSNAFSGAMTRPAQAPAPQQRAVAAASAYTRGSALRAQQAGGTGNPVVNNFMQEVASLMERQGQQGKAAAFKRHQ